MIRQFELEDGHPADDDGAPDALVVISRLLDSLRAPRSHDGGTSAVLAKNSGARPSSGGGIRMLFVLYEGWHNNCPWLSRAANPAEPPNSDAYNRVHSWGFECSKPWTIYRSGKLFRWFTLMREPPPGPFKYGKPHYNPWGYWYLGSGNNALAGRYPTAFVEPGAGREVERTLRELEVACREYGWPELEGGDVLGWVRGTGMAAWRNWPPNDPDPTSLM
jgi:hypothetical protein